MYVELYCIRGRVRRLSSRFKDYLRWCYIEEIEGVDITSPELPEPQTLPESSND